MVRTLDPDDILITDESGPISMAGTMGGLNTEIDETSTDLVIEAAHFDARGTAKMSRRHKLHSEASYRFERGVDRELPLRASAKAVALLAGLGGGPGRAGLHARVGRGRAGADLDGGGLPGPGGRRGVRPGHRGPAAARGGLLRAADPRGRPDHRPVAGGE